MLVVGPRSRDPVASLPSRVTYCVCQEWSRLKPATIVTAISLPSATPSQMSQRMKTAQCGGDVVNAKRSSQSTELVRVLRTGHLSLSRSRHPLQCQEFLTKDEAVHGHRRPSLIDHTSSCIGANAISARGRGLDDALGQNRTISVPCVANLAIICPPPIG
jgi:hypothetical protein